MSREEVTVLSGEDLVSGTVLGKITIGGKYVAYDDDGTDDGRRDAAGVLLYDCDATVFGSRTLLMH
ncbi:MAG: hypothetical protein C1943_15520 [Halochromatium sp.]|nr:hypothetical protein [Halochromatium sp.]